MFKVGDWVRDLVLGKVFMLEEVDLVKPYIYCLHNCEIWQPKEGEWCWVDKNLSKIVAYDRDGYATCLNSNGTYTAYMKLEYIYEIAEPFIGELPSFLQH